MNIKSYNFYYELRSLHFVEQIWLFGSRARGNAQGSDFDVAIVCPKASDKDWDIIKKIVKDADSIIKIDVIRYDALPEQDVLRVNILKDHVVLFERKQNSYVWYDAFLDLGEALERLGEVVVIPEYTNSYVKDAAIQRFEICIELFWKTLKKICVAEGFNVTSPKSTLEKAFENKLLQDSPIWLSMLEDRNMTSHVYKRLIANEIYYKIDSYYVHMKDAYMKIKERYKV